MGKKAAVIVALALLVPACGGGDGAGDVIDSTSENLETAVVEADASVFALRVSAEVAAATDTFIEQFGPDDAIDAVLLAADSGYTADQLVGAAGEGTLRADGTLADGDGSLAPEGVPAGVITRVSGLLSAGITFSVDAWRAAVKDAVEAGLRDGTIPPRESAVADAQVATESHIGVFVIDTLVQMMRDGFTAEQAILALVSGARYKQIWCSELDAQYYDCSARVDLMCAVVEYPDGSKDTVGEYCQEFIFDDDSGGPAPAGGTETPQSSEAPVGSTETSESREEPVETVETSESGEADLGESDQPTVFTGSGTATSEITYVEAELIGSCVLETEMTLTLLPRGKLEFSVGDLPSVNNDECGTVVGQVHVGAWERDVDGIIYFEIEGVGEPSPERVNGSVQEHGAEGFGGFTAETVRKRDDKVVTIFYLQYDFLLQPVAG